MIQAESLDAFQVHSGSTVMVTLPEPPATSADTLGGARLTWHLTGEGSTSVDEFVQRV